MAENRRTWYGPSRTWDGHGLNLPIPNEFDTWPFRKQVYEHPRYHMVEASDIVRVDPSTLRRWLKGGRNNGTYINPIITGEQRDDPHVSWFELVTAAYLDEYRRTGSLHGMRSFLQTLAKVFSDPYPIANLQTWKTESWDTLHQIQQQVSLLPRLWVVEERNGTLQLTETAERFLNRLSFDEEGLASYLILVPVEREDEAPIIARPGKSGGVPILRNLRTDFFSALYYGEIDRGNNPDGAIAEVMDMYQYNGITKSDVERALEFSHYPNQAA